MLHSEPRSQGQNQGLNIFENAGLGLEISVKKIIPRKTEWTDTWFVPAEFRLFRGTKNSRNSVPNHFLEEETA